ncbi:MAG: hypothetical protein F6K30_17335 [Cyanothece sp. SIO2G6]|nr:hypothetical protein [Cyanothece sp. SIO2G6]
MISGRGNTITVSLPIIYPELLREYQRICWWVGIISDLSDRVDQWRTLLLCWAIATLWASFFGSSGLCMLIWLANGWKPYIKRLLLNNKRIMGSIALKPCTAMILAKTMLN